MRYTDDPKNHGYDFRDAPQVIESEDTVTLGMLRGTVVVIVTAETDDEIRIISMRKAERDEQEIYYQSR